MSNQDHTRQRMYCFHGVDTEFELKLHKDVDQRNKAREALEAQQAKLRSQKAADTPER